MSALKRPWFFLFWLCLLFYTCARVQFLLWNWPQFQNQSHTLITQAFAAGLRFDLAAVAMTFVLFLPFIYLFRGHRKTQWLAFNMIQQPFLLLNFIDVEMINFAGRRWTWDSLFILGESQGKFWGFMKTYGGLISLEIFLMLLFAFLSYHIICSLNLRKTANIIVSPLNAEKQKIFLGPFLFQKASVFALLRSFLVLVIWVIAIRGGLQTKPLSFVHSQIFAAPMLNNLVLNSPFTVVKSFGKEDLQRVRFFENREEMNSHLNGFINTPSLLEGHRPDRPNVVLIILESFGLEYMGKINGVQGYTPFLDQLAEKSLFFPNGIANGRRSIEGMAAIMAGIPALMNEPFISSPFATNYFLGLGTLLSQKSYHTSFFHGGQNGTMYFDSFMKSVGVENYFGLNEYPHSENFDGVWGIFDEPFFQFYAEKLSQFPQPFFSGFFSLSSHQPYTVPKQYEDELPEGPIEILKSIAYTDLALRKFFERVEKEPWYSNTLFVITADHTSKSYLPQYDNELGHYRIPILFFHPQFAWPSVDTSVVAQQIDIFPSILDFVGMDPGKKNGLNRSLFVPGDRYAVTYIDGRYMLVTKDHFLVRSPKHDAVQIFRVQDAAETAPLENPELKEDLEKKLHATMQYFSEGLWDNRLYYPTN